MGWISLSKKRKRAQIIPSSIQFPILKKACSRKLRDDNKEIRFRPDFILIRQQPVSKQHRTVLLGLKLGGIPSINSLHSIYNMFDPPWVFAQLARIRMRFGPGLSIFTQTSSLHYYQEFPVTTKTFMPTANCLRRFRDFPAIVSSSNRSGKKISKIRTIDLFFRCPPSS